MSQKIRKNLENLKKHILGEKSGYIIASITVILTGIYECIICWDELKIYFHILIIPIIQILFGILIVIILIWAYLSTKSLFIAIKDISQDLISEINNIGWLCETRILKLTLSENGDGRVTDLRAIRNLSNKSNQFDIPHQPILWDSGSTFGPEIIPDPPHLVLKVDTAQGNTRPIKVRTENISTNDIFIYSINYLMKNGFPDPEREYFEGKSKYDNGNIPTLRLIFDFKIPKKLTPHIDNRDLYKFYIEQGVEQSVQCPSEMVLLPLTGINDYIITRVIIFPVDFQSRYRIYWNWKK